MKSIKRNKMLIEGFPTAEVVEVGLQRLCKNRVCVVIWSFALRYYQEALISILSEDRKTSKCKACQQVVHEGKWDGEFHTLMQLSGIIIITCTSVEQATHICQNLEEEKRKVGDVRGVSRYPTSNECYRTFEVWNEGHQVLMKPETEEAK